MYICTFTHNSIHKNRNEKGKKEGREKAKKEREGEKMRKKNKGPPH